MMRVQSDLLRNAVCMLLLAAAVVACHRESPEITEADLQAHINTLSDDGFAGRESGTKYARAAAAYLVRRYQRAGLFAPFAADGSLLQEVPEQAGSYVQSFEFQGGVVAEPGSYARFVSSDDVSFAIPDQDLVPLPLGYAGQAKGEVIFLGFCLEAQAQGWNDFAGLDAAQLEGRIALCLRHGPGGEKDSKYGREIAFRAKYENLVKRKMAGVIFLGHEGYPAPEPADLGGVSTRQVPAVFIQPGPLFSQYEFLADAEKQMRAESRPHESVGRVLGTADIATRLREQTMTGYNVAALLRAPEPTDRTIIVGAHFDHIGRGAFSSIRGKGGIHNGADDNASGTAAVLEAALYLQALRSDLPVPEDFAGYREMLRNVNVLFIHFDAEERGLFGSRAFVKQAGLSAEKIVAMINLDMVGRLRPDKGMNVQGAQTADSRWEQIIRDAFAATEFPEDVGLRMVQGGGGPSDHSSFYSHATPVAFLFTGGHREYHTPDDDAHLINLAGLKKVTELTTRLVVGLAGLEHAAAQKETGAGAGPLAFRRAPQEAVRTDFEFRVRLGIMPGDYSRDAGGLEVADVKDDAPVKRTGLRAGDVITKLGEREIRDIHDYMEFMSDASATKEYAIEFKRGDQVIRGRTRLIAAP